MDRLSPLSLLFLGACAGDSQPPPAAPSRVNSVAAAPKKAVDLKEFCEVHPDAAAAPPYAWPSIDAPAPASPGTWTWVNVWATWCGPCVEEMPRLLEWQPKLSSEGAPVALQLLSADADAQLITNFRKKNAWMPESARLQDPGAVGPWLAGFGKQGDPVLPVHLFVDPAGKVRCIREGAISLDDYEAVKTLLKAG